MLSCRVAGCLLLALAALGCGTKPAAPPTALNPTTQQPVDAKLNEPVAGFVPQKLAAEHLPNPWRIHPKVISGGLPEGEAAFAELARLRIKTVISVDGAKPDVETAKKHGLRYVHLPHGYDGVPENRMQELAKTVRDLPGPIYIHCHHGKHRSPAAAAVACVGAGLLDPTDAVPVLLAAGTSESYQGLYQSAREAHRFETKLLDNLAAEFPEMAKLPPFAEAMVAVEHTHDHLKQIAAAGWKTPQEHPALEPAHQALLLREHFTEMLRTKELQGKPERFQQLTKDAEAASQALENALKSPLIDAEAASRLFLAVSNNCKVCHQEFRDVPLSEKTNRQ